MFAGEKKPAGPPTAGEPAFLAVGLLRRPHGLRGEAVVEIYTDFPDRIQPGCQLYAGDEHIPLYVHSRRNHKNGLLLTFDGIETPEQIGRLRNRVLYVSARDRPALPVGEYYHHQLLGLDVIDETGQTLGALVEIITTGANDVYVVRSPGGKEILIPVIPGVVQKVDLTGRKLHVHLPRGLIEAEED